MWLSLQKKRKEIGKELSLALQWLVHLFSKYCFFYLCYRVKYLHKVVPHLALEMFILIVVHCIENNVVLYVHVIKTSVICTTCI